MNGEDIILIGIVSIQNKSADFMVSGSKSRNSLRSVHKRQDTQCIRSYVVYMTLLRISCKSLLNDIFS